MLAARVERQVKRRTGGCLARGVSTADHTNLNQGVTNSPTLQPAPPPTKPSPALYTDRCLSNCPSRGLSKKITFHLKMRAGFQIPPRHLLKDTVRLLTGVPNASLAPNRALGPCAEATWLITPSAAGLGKAPLPTVVGLVGFFLGSRERKVGFLWIYSARWLLKAAGTCENQHKMKRPQHGGQEKTKAGSRPPLLATSTS